MTNTPKRDYEVFAIMRKIGMPDVYRYQFLEGYRQAESELLPIINKQAEEIEKLKAGVKHWEDRFEALVGERSADMAGNKVITLQSSFDGLLKKLEDSIDKEVDDPIGDEKHLLVRYVDIQSIIKKARGE